MRNYFFLIKSYIIGEFVGQDDLKNKYFRSRKNHKKRWVIYQGIEDPTKIVPKWYNWMHGMDDEPILKDQFYTWQIKKHLPNMTGTVARFSPKKTNEKAKHKPGFKTWGPS